MPKTLDPPKTIRQAFSKKKNFRSSSVSMSIPKLLPLPSIGFEVALQAAGWPINRMTMLQGKAHAGKTSLANYVAAMFVRYGAEVVYLESDKALDTNYLGRFYDFDLEGEAAITEPLKYYIDDLENSLKNDEADGITLNLWEKHLAKAQEALKGYQEGSKSFQEIVFIAQNAYRMQNVMTFPATTAEELEKVFQNVLDYKLKNDPKGLRPLIFVADPLGNFVPEEDMKLKNSSSGRSMSVSLFLNKFYRRWTGKLSDANVHFLFTSKHTAFVKTDIFTMTEEMDEVNTIGGNSQKLAASTVIQMKMSGIRHPTLEDDWESHKEGVMVVPKKKIQGGYFMPKGFKSKYWLYTDKKNTRFDFDTPLMMQVLDKGLFDIKCERGKVTCPPECIPEHLEKERKAGSLTRKQALDLLPTSEGFKNHIRGILGIDHHLAYLIAEQKPVSQTNSPEASQTNEEAEEQSD